jgi:hypothetical protein
VPPAVANIHNHFNLERHLVDRETYKQRRSAALAIRAAPGIDGGGEKPDGSL